MDSTAIYGVSKFFSVTLFLLSLLPLHTAFPHNSSTSSSSSGQINSNSILVALLDSHYTELAELVEKALLLQKLEEAVGNHNITIFAPRNQALERDLDPEFKRFLLEPRNLRSLQTLLMSHILPSRIASHHWPATDLRHLTLSNHRLHLTTNPSGKKSVDSAEILRPDDVLRPDGVIHGIERLIVPRSVQEDFNRRRNLHAIAAVLPAKAPIVSLTPAKAPLFRLHRSDPHHRHNPPRSSFYFGEASFLHPRRSLPDLVIRARGYITLAEGVMATPPGCPVNLPSEPKYHHYKYDYPDAKRYHGLHTWAFGLIITAVVVIVLGLLCICLVRKSSPPVNEEAAPLPLPEEHRVDVALIDAGIKANNCIEIILVSSKEEFDDAPESCIINPVGLNRFFEDDGNIFGYKDLKITIWVSSISFYAYADITFQSSSDQGKGITDLDSALQAIFYETLVDNKDEFLQKLVDKDFVRTNISNGEVLKLQAFKGHICDSNEHADSATSNVEVVRLVAGNMATGQLYSHLRPLTLLLVDGSRPIDDSDPHWELYVVVQKKTDEQGEIQCMLTGFAAVYRFDDYLDDSRLGLGQILVLPPYQHKDYDCFLLEVLYEVAISENVVDLTVELPSDHLEHVHSCINTLRLLHFEPIKHPITKAISILKEEMLSHSCRLMPPLSAIEDVRKSLKITKKQFLQCWEVLIYIGLHPDPINNYMENFNMIISNHVKNDMRKDSGTSQEMSFVMFRAGATEASTVHMDDNQTNQEEQLRNLVQDRVKEIQLIAEKVRLKVHGVI